MSTPTWLTAKADAASLPALLDRLVSTVQPAQIDNLWVFPTRRVMDAESTVFVLALYEEADRRRVVTAHFRATRNKRGEALIESRLEEHGVTPANRVQRVIDGVLRRLSEDFATTPPASAEIHGSNERWNAAIEALSAVRPGDPLPEVLIDGQGTEPLK
jgi:hypothetical protein